MNIRIVLTTIMAIFLGIAPAFAGERGTPQEAEALVKKAMEFYKANGAEKSYVEFSNRSGPFIDRDLYVMVFGLDGKVLAHGINPKVVGKDLLEMQDADGKYYNKERVELAKTKTSFWMDYKYSDPLTKKVLPKTAYCERTDVIICAGAYKQ